MGLASSQARLLTLTSRQHSVEGEAQRIMANKMRLANDSDRVYQKYLNALDETLIKTRQTNASGQNVWIDASVNNLLRYNASEDTSGTVFYVQNMKDGSLYLPAELGQAYDESADEYEFASKFGVNYTRVDHNEDILKTYNKMVNLGYNTLLGPTPEDADVILAEFANKVNDDQAKKTIAAMMLTQLPSANTNGVYELSRFLDTNARSFITALDNIIQSRLYEDAYTPQERALINAAMSLAMGAVSPDYPQATTVETPYTYYVTGSDGYPYPKDGKMVTKTTYALKDLKVIVNTSAGAKDYSVKSGSQFDNFDLINMMLNGGTRYVSATKTVSVTYAQDDTTHSPSSTTSLYEESKDIYTTVQTYGSTAKSILNNYNSSMTTYGEALRKIFQDASTIDSLSQKYLDSKGLTTDDINNYKKYLNAKADYDSYFPDIEMVPDNKVASQYYREIYNAIKSAGGWTEASDTSAKSASWVTNMVKSNQVILTTWDAQNSMLSKTADSLHYNLREISNQNKIEVASQEYEEELATINDKDSKLDTRLEKLETEREAIEYQIKAMKDVAEQNVSTTFKVFT